MQVNLEEANMALWRSIRCGDPACGHTFCGRCGQPPHRRAPDKTDKDGADITCEDYAKSLKAGKDDEANAALTREYLAAQNELTQVCPHCKATATQVAGV